MNIWFYLSVAFSLGAWVIAANFERVRCLFGKHDDVLHYRADDEPGEQLRLRCLVCHRDTEGF